MGRKHRRRQGVVFSVELPTGREHFDEKDIEVYFDDNTAGSKTADEAEAVPA